MLAHFTYFTVSRETNHWYQAFLDTVSFFLLHFSFFHPAVLTHLLSFSLLLLAMPLRHRASVNTLIGVYFVLCFTSDTAHLSRENNPTRWETLNCRAKVQLLFYSTSVADAFFWSCIHISYWILLCNAGIFVSGLYPILIASEWALLVNRPREGI